MGNKSKRTRSQHNKKQAEAEENESTRSPSSIRVRRESTGAASRQGPNGKEGDSHSRERQDSTLATYRQSVTSSTKFGSNSDHCSCSGMNDEKLPEVQLNGEPIKACGGCEEGVYAAAGCVMPSRSQSRVRSSSLFGRWSSEVQLKHGKEAVEELEVGREAVETHRGQNKSRVFSEADVSLEDWMRAALVREYEESLQQEFEEDSKSAVRIHHAGRSS